MISLGGQFINKLLIRIRIRIVYWTEKTHEIKQQLFRHLCSPRWGLPRGPIRLLAQKLQYIHY